MTTNNRSKNGKNNKPPPSKVIDNIQDAEIALMLNQFVRNTLTRADFSRQAGMQFEGDRDLYATFGYKRQLAYDDYRTMYDRLGIATRLVEKFSNDTWNEPLVLIDGDARSDGVGEKTTPFLEDFNAMAKRLKMWTVLREADIMSGIGRYSVILMGTAGELSQPIPAGATLNYIAAYDEKQAEIKTYVTDTASERYGLPKTYRITLSNMEGQVPATPVDVDASRCIHVSENRLGSRVFGRPRLQEVYNRLMDYEKVTGGGAEAAWLAVYMGFLILTREGVELPPENTTEWRQTEEAIQKFAHRIQRFATLRGVEEVVNLGVHEVRIKDIYSVMCSDLAGSKGIPMRILFGSERGELASTQDMHEWNGVIRSRRTNFAEPEMLDPFMAWCIAHEVVRPPSTPTGYKTEWQPVYSMTKIQEADYAFKVSQGANMLMASNGTIAVDVNEFRGMLHLPPKDLAELEAKLNPQVPEEEEEVKVDLKDVQPANGKISADEEQKLKETI